MLGITVSQMLEEQSKALDLVLRAGEEGLNRLIRVPEMNRPALAFAGFYEVFSHDRVQIVGLTEVSYLRNLRAGDLRRRLSRSFEFEIPCLIITTNLEPPPLFFDLAAERKIPVLRTPLQTSIFWAKLSLYLEHEFAPTEVVHASMLDVFGLGVLIMGRSGVGKSECALELIERGHRLISDDTVVLKRLGPHTITGTAAAAVAHHMEVRGIGIVDVEKLFGAGSVCEEKPVSLIVQLERWVEGKTYERAGLEECCYQILGVDLPEYVIPVEPGRNISLLVEVAALTQRLRSQGYNPAAELNRRLIDRMHHRRLGQRLQKTPVDSNGAAAPATPAEGVVPFTPIPAGEEGTQSPVPLQGGASIAQSSDFQPPPVAPPQNNND